MFSSSSAVRLIAWLVVGAGLFLSTPCFAQESSQRVVLVTNHADAAIMPLLQDELQRLGFDVSLMDKGEGEIVAGDLAKAARKQGAIAAFRVLVAKGTVEVWIADRVTGKVVLRELFAQPSTGKVSETVVVLRAVELLRASLMEVEAPHPPRGEVAPSPTLYSVIGYPEEAARIGVEVGPAAIVSTGGMPMLWGARLALRARFSPSFQAVAFGISSLADASKREAEGEVALGAWMVGAGLRLEPPPSSQRFVPSAGAGVSMVATKAQGIASPPYQGFSHDSLSLAPYASAGVGLVLHKNLRLTAEVLGGIGSRPLVLSFDNRRVASFGEVLFSPLLHVDMVLP